MIPSSVRTNRITRGDFLWTRKVWNFLKYTPPIYYITATKNIYKNEQAIISRLNPGK
jgi:hypothetical protein